MPRSRRRFHPRSAPASNDLPPDAQTHAPQSPPVKMRANKPTSAVRFGVLGSLSATNSPIASRENITTAVVDPINATGEPSRFNRPRCVAHATTAGAVNERKPATIPIPPARTKMCFTNNLSVTAPDISTLYRQIHSFAWPCQDRSLPVTMLHGMNSTSDVEIRGVLPAFS